MRPYCESHLVFLHAPLPVDIANGITFAVLAPRLACDCNTREWKQLSIIKVMTGTHFKAKLGLEIVNHEVAQVEIAVPDSHLEGYRSRPSL